MMTVINRILSELFLAPLCSQKAGLTLLLLWTAMKQRQLDSKVISFVWFILFLTFITGTRVGRIKIIFSLPKIIERPGYQESAPKEWPTQPLAYVEWYTRQGTLADKTHGMYKVFPAYDSQGRQQGSIIPLSNIRQSCMLIPVFPKPRTQKDQNLEGWTPGNVLDKAKAFLINNFLDLYTFQTVW